MRYILHHLEPPVPYLYYVSSTLSVSPQFPSGLYDGQRERTGWWLADGDDLEQSGASSRSGVCETDVNGHGLCQSV